MSARQASAPTVLVVEDDPTDILLVRRAFARTGPAAQLQVVEHGEAALEYLGGVGECSDRSRFPLPALMLLDLKLPRLSGLEVLSWVRQQPGLRRLPIVVLTSSRQSQDLKLAYDRGVNSYLLKPVEFAALQALIGMVGSYWLELNQGAALDA